MNIIVYDAWGDLRFESYDSVAACHYSLIVTLPAIVRGLVAEAEFILLAQLLYAVTVCTYPSKLIHTLAGRLDLVLPGEDRDSIDILDSLHFVRPTRRWWWRAPLAHERPRMIFHEVTMTKFRGPAFTEEIKVSACPAHIALFADGAGNWRIALIPSPNALADSQTLFLDIPGHMLIALLRHLISGQEKLNLSKHGAPHIVQSTINNITSRLGFPSSNHHADLWEFIKLRIEITDEDSAHRRPPGFCRSRRKRSACLANKALARFERWINREDSIMHPTTMSRMIRDAHETLIAIDAKTSSIESYKSLALTPLPCDNSHAHIEHSSPWLRKPVLPQLAPVPFETHTVQISLDDHGDFAIRVVRAQFKEIVSRIVGAENQQMVTENKSSLNARGAYARDQARTCLANKLAQARINIIKSTVGRFSKKSAFIVSKIIGLRRWHGLQIRHIKHMRWLARVAVTVALPRLCIVLGESSRCHLTLPSDTWRDIAWNNSDTDRTRLQTALSVKVMSPKRSCSYWYQISHSILIARCVVSIPVCQGSRLGTDRVTLFLTY